MGGSNLTELLNDTATLNDILELKSAFELQIKTMQATQDELYLIISAIGIMGLQAGFAMLETGVARAKNTKAVLMKNLLDFAFGIWVWYLVGWGLFRGDNKFISGEPFSFALTDETEFAYFIQQFGFAITGSTIMSGSVLSRMRFELYIPVAMIFTGVIYPISAHWAWNPVGWLKTDFGFEDFAGSGVVHMVGGIYGLVGAWMCGPRVGRFIHHDFGEPKITIRSLPGHSSTLQVLGLFMLVLGWMFFNAGSSPGTDEYGIRLASRALINSCLALSTASTVTVAMMFFKDKVQHLSEAVNGILAGLVAITGPCGFVDTWAACLIGVVAGFAYLGTSRIVLHKLHIDDPLDAFAVHGVCGALGLICIGLLDKDRGLFTTGNGELILAQLLGLGTLLVWAVITALIIFIALDKAFGVALDEDDQLLGLDVKYHEGYAYPDFSAQDVMEYNRTRDAAVRKMGPKRYDSESFEYSESSINSGEHGLSFRTAGSGSVRNLRVKKKNRDRSSTRNPEDSESEAGDDGYV